MIRKIIILSLILNVTISAFADVIVFKSGKTVEGIITKVTPTGITALVGNDIIGASFTQIKDIRESTRAGAQNSLFIDQARAYVLSPATIQTTSQSSRIAQTRGDVYSTLSAESQVKKPRAYKSVEVYITSWCPWCRRLIADLNRAGIRYTAYDIDKNREANKKYNKLGQSGIPVTVVNGQVFSGYAPQSIIAAVNSD